MLHSRFCVTVGYMKNKIEKYITKTLPFSPKLREKEKKVQLPAYLRFQYEYLSMQILDIEVVFITKTDSSEWTTVPELRKHVATIEKLFSAKPVLVFEKKAPRRLPLLVKHNLAYVYLEKEIYLPFLTLKIRTDSIEKLEVTLSDLKGIPQIIVTHQLIHEDLEGESVTNIAKKLGLIKMSVSRALAQLEIANFCSIETQGKSKLHYFPSKDELWKLTHSKMVNPVRQIVHLENLPRGIDPIKSGESALAEQTLIDDISGQTFAIQSKEIKDLHLVEGVDTPITLELWHWDPRVNATKNITDPISTYFSLLHTEDERIAIARDEYLATIGLKPINKDI